MWIIVNNYTLFCIAVSSGSVTINADSSVQVLAEMAVPLDQLDSAVSQIILSFVGGDISFLALQDFT